MLSLLLFLVIILVTMMIVMDDSNDSNDSNDSKRYLIINDQQPLTSIPLVMMTVSFSLIAHTSRSNHPMNQLML